MNSQYDDQSAYTEIMAGMSDAGSDVNSFAHLSGKAGSFIEPRFSNQSKHNNPRFTAGTATKRRNSDLARVSEEDSKDNIPSIDQLIDEAK